MGDFTNMLVGLPKPETQLYWLGAPSNYNETDDLLKKFPDGDLGGRYMGLPKSTSPHDLFDVTIKMFMALHADGVRKAQTMGRPAPESVLCQAIQMTWIFTSEQTARLESRIKMLEEKFQALLDRTADPT